MAEYNAHYLFYNYGTSSQLSGVSRKGVARLITENAFSLKTSTVAIDVITKPLQVHTA